MKKTGNCYHYEPLRSELNDTFGVMKNVTPDSVFSNIKGLQVNPHSDKTQESDENGGDEEPQLVTPTSDEPKEKKKPSKSMFNIVEQCINMTLFKYIIDLQLSTIFDTLNAGRQPVVQQVKTCFDDVKDMYREESNRIDNKIDALLQIQRERLELEKEHLAFEREKAGLPGEGTLLFYGKFLIMSHSKSLFVTPPELDLCKPATSSTFTSVSSSSAMLSNAVSSSSSSIRHQLCKTQHATTHWILFLLLVNGSKVTLGNLNPNNANALSITALLDDKCVLNFF